MIETQFLTIRSIDPSDSYLCLIYEFDRRNSRSVTDLSTRVPNSLSSFPLSYCRMPPYFQSKQHPPNIQQMVSSIAAILLSVILYPISATLGLLAIASRKVAVPAGVLATGTGILWTFGVDSLKAQIVQQASRRIRWATCRGLCRSSSFISSNRLWSVCSCNSWSHNTRGFLCQGLKRI